MTRSHHILIVSDDLTPAKYYHRALERKGCNVGYCRLPSEALDYARRHADSISGVVLDIMMPPENRYTRPDNPGGLRTGIFLYPDLRNECPNALFVVLTSVANPVTLRLVEERGLEVFRLFEWTAFDFADRVLELLSRL